MKMLAMLLETRTWDIGPGIAALLTAVVSLVGVYLTAKLKEIHVAVNSTAAALAVAAKQREEELATSRKETADARLRISELVASVAMAKELSDAKAKAVEVLRAVEKDREIASLKSAPAASDVKVHLGS